MFLLFIVCYTIYYTIFIKYVNMFLRKITHCCMGPLTPNKNRPMLYAIGRFWVTGAVALEQGGLLHAQRFLDDDRALLARQRLAAFLLGDAQRLGGVAGGEQIGQ